MKDRNHDEAMAEIYKNDPAYAFKLLNSIFEDGDQGEGVWCCSINRLGQQQINM